MTRFLAFLGTVAVAAAGVATSTGSTTSDLHGRFFRTPSGNIACEVDEHAAVGPFKGQRTLFCVVFSASSETRGQRTWLMRVTGRARATWVMGISRPRFLYSPMGGRGVSRGSAADRDGRD